MKPNDFEENTIPTLNITDVDKFRALIYITKRSDGKGAINYID